MVLDVCKSTLHRCRVKLSQSFITANGAIVSVWNAINQLCPTCSVWSSMSARFMSSKHQAKSYSHKIAVATMLQVHENICIRIIKLFSSSRRNKSSTINNRLKSTRQLSLAQLRKSITSNNQCSKTSLTMCQLPLSHCSWRSHRGHSESCTQKPTLSTSKDCRATRPMWVSSRRLWKQQKSRLVMTFLVYQLIGLARKEKKSPKRWSMLFGTCESQCGATRLPCTEICSKSARYQTNFFSLTI